VPPYFAGLLGDAIRAVLLRNQRRSSRSSPGQHSCSGGGGKIEVSASLSIIVVALRKMQSLGQTSRLA